jgi:hypothetical protein
VVELCGIRVAVCWKSSADYDKNRQKTVGDKPYKGTLTKRRREERILNIRRQLK